jgi:hypothetical protein
MLLGEEKKKGRKEVAIPRYSSIPPSFLPTLSPLLLYNFPTD